MTKAKLEKIKEELGEINKPINIYVPNWADIRENVVKVTLSVYFFRGEIKLRSEDLGIDDPTGGFDDFLKNTVRLGTKLILPVDILNQLANIEQKARTTLYAYSYDTTLGRLVTTKSYESFVKRITPLRDEFFALRDSVVNNYDRTQEQVRNSYRILAWKAIKNHAPNEEPSIEMIDRMVDQSIMVHFPTKEHLANSFFMDWQVAYVDVPHVSNLSVERELGSMEKQKAALTKQIEALNNKATKLSDKNYQKEEKLRLKLDAERAELNQQIALRQEMNAKLQESYKQQIENSIAEFFTQINQTLYETSTNVLMTLSNPYNKGKLVGRSLSSLKEWVEKVRALNFYETEDAGKAIASMIDEVNRRIQVPVKDVDSKDLQQVLEGIRSFSMKSLAHLGVEPIRTKREQEQVEVLEEGKRQRSVPEESIEPVTELLEVRPRKPRREKVAV